MWFSIGGYIAGGYIVGVHILISRVDPWALSDIGHASILTPKSGNPQNR